MQSGNILVAQHEGSYVIKFVGDVRLTLCARLDNFLEKMFRSKTFSGVLVDVSDAENIDSTSLGLLAKLAIKNQKNTNTRPIILSPNENITRLLDSMGFSKIFDIRGHLEYSANGDLNEIPDVVADESAMREKIIDAHKVLMDLNEKNHDTFKTLVTSLEASR